MAKRKTKKKAVVKKTPEKKAALPVLLGPEHDLNKFCAREAGAYALNDVVFRSSTRNVEASDRRILIRVPVRSCKKDEFPSTPGQKASPDADAQFPGTAIADAMKHVSKATAKLKPILGCALLTQDASGAVLSVTDTSNSVDARHTATGSWPDTSEVLESDKGQDAIRSFTVNAILLKRVVDHAVKHGQTIYHDSSEEVRLRFHLFKDQCKAVEFAFTLEANSECEVTGGIMPVVGE